MTKKTVFDCDCCGEEIRSVHDSMVSVEVKNKSRRKTHEKHYCIDCWKWCVNPIRVNPDHECKKQKAVKQPDILKEKLEELQDD